MRHGELTHNALDDAIQQAKEFAKILRMMKQEEETKGDDDFDIPF